MTIDRRRPIALALLAPALLIGLGACNGASTEAPSAPAQSSLPPGAGSPVTPKDTATPTPTIDDEAPANPTSPGPTLDDDNRAPTARTSPIPTRLPSDTRTPITKPGKKGTPRGLALKPSTVDRADADAVATAFGILLGSYDTTIDNSPNDAGRRAIPIATLGLAKDLKQATSVIGPDADWVTLERHHGYTTVKTQLGGLGPVPSAAPTSTQRAVTMTIQRHGNKWSPPPDNPQTLLLTLHRTKPGADWAVAEFKYL